MRRVRRLVPLFTPFNRTRILVHNASIVHPHSYAQLLHVSPFLLEEVDKRWLSGRVFAVRGSTFQGGGRLRRQEEEEEEVD